MPILETEARRLILASQSPRRSELLGKIVTAFEVVVSNADEVTHHTDPKQVVLENAQRKAESVARSIDDGIIIGADSVVVLDQHILGKPRDREEAVWMLKLLSGRTHAVYTGIAIIDMPGNTISTDIEITDVTFRRLDSWEIDRYIEVEPPYDKAGSYGIQDSSAVFVSGIKGCYFNVMGLPLSRLFRILLPFYKP
ncbi:septum formation protein Maf [candidate division KSB1 bacterium]|nr:septum formation protein Maf [candidate division KSB1 bacterium]